MLAAAHAPAGPGVTLTPVYTYHVVATYPHSATAFTQGLVFTDGVLYEGTGIAGESSLRKVDLTTGAVLQQRNLSSSDFGEGITIVSNTIYQLTWQNGFAYTYDKISFTPIVTFNYDTQGWGLAYDGARLIMSDGTSTLYFRDPATFAVLGQVTVTDNGAPINMLNELEFIHGEVWANKWMTDLIARIDPATGHVTGWVDLAGIITPHPRITDGDAVLNGIAYDDVGDRLFVTGKRWPKLFEIEVGRRLYLPIMNRQ